MLPFMSLLNRRYCALILGILAVLPAGTTLAAMQYETGLSNVIRISQDLRRALPASDRQILTFSPVMLEKIDIPYAQPREYALDRQRIPAISISPGFIDFANYLAHAKAIDEYQHGFYRRYVESISLQRNLQRPPAMSQEAWSFNTLNHQASRFNQIVGGLIAIDMAHHYLGHYRKYAPQMANAGNHLLSINAFLTPEEWHAAVMRGARNALDCGFSPDGLKLVFDALGNPKTRPVWAIYLVPSDADERKLAKDLSKMEAQFFAGLSK